MKCTERRKRREASSFVASLLAILALLGVSRGFVTFGVTFGVLAVTITGCAAGTGSVGAMLGKDNHTGKLFVREVPPAMAAAKAGLRDGDEVIAIDTIPVGEMSPQEVHQRLSGKVGTKVVLLIVRDGTMERIEVVREPLASE